MKKTISLFIAVLLMLSVIPFSASASEVINLYTLSDAYTQFISIPEDMNQEFQLPYTGSEKYYTSGGTALVSSSGLVTPRSKKTFWYGNIGYSSPLADREPDRVVTTYYPGQSTVTVEKDGASTAYTVNVIDYAEYYANQKIDEFIAENYQEGMSEYEIIRMAAKMAASYDYSVYASSAVPMIVRGGGDCWASTSLVNRICAKFGIEAWSRNGNRDPGAGSGHMNSMARTSDGEYYEIEAGIYSLAPRPFFVKKRSSLFSYSEVSDGIEVYQYDGKTDPEILEVPETIDGKTVVSLSQNALYDRDSSKIILPDTIKRIGEYALCACSELEEITLPRDLESMDGGVFVLDKKLKTIHNNSSNFKVIDNVVYTADGKEIVAMTPHEELNIPAGVEKIGRCLISEDEKLKAVTIPSTVTTIGEGAFYMCTSLDKVYIPSSVTVIDRLAFSAPTCIFGEPGSAAEQCANENNLHFNTAHSWDEGTVWIKPTCDREGTVEYKCSLCNYSKREVLPPKDHTLELVNQRDATCQEEGYTGDMRCKDCWRYIEVGTTIEKLPHTPGEAVKENVIPATCTADGGYDEVRVCTVCGETVSNEHITIPQKPHTPGSAVYENEIPATCTAKGEYDVVVRCAECGVELQRQHVVTEKLSHTPKAAVKENVIAATCTEPGRYDEVVYCAVCNAELDRTTKTVSKLGHTPKAAVKENEIAPTCTEPGRYDEVTYCSVCNAELDRTTKTVSKLGHTPKAAVKENEIAPTCTEPGRYDEVVYCDVCGEEISRETKTVPARGHTPKDAVIENEIPESCTDGSYDAVIYCAVCNAELDRTTKTIPAIGHIPSTALKENVNLATCTEAGSYEEVVYCAVCGEEIGRDVVVVPPRGHLWDAGCVTLPATSAAEGLKTYTCRLCGETYTESIPRLNEKNGWIKENNKWYYYTSNVAAKGWKQIGGKWYYFNTSGVMLNGWRKISGKWYYFNTSGAMLSGWQKISNKWYYFNTGGDMVTGWKKIGSSWYYFESSGAMRTANLKQGGKTYRFNSSGACLNP